jgi:hypothetical protein
MKKTLFLILVVLINVQCKTKKPLVNDAFDVRTSQHFNGEFLYFADAPVFRSCENQKVLPVMKDKDYIEAERKYMFMAEGGTWLYTEFTGGIILHKNEEGTIVSMYLIENLILMDTDRKCTEK